jgi:cytochrome c553
MKKTMFLILLAIFGCVQAYADDFSASKTDRKLCSVCHGYNGTTSSELFPQLAGQPKEYLATELKEFKDHTRFDVNAKRFMWGIASRLTDDQIEALAEFYSSQQTNHHGKITNQALYSQGENIFLNGNPDKGVPACFACHGQKAEGHDNIARLGGQNENYLLRQLHEFQHNNREQGHVMNTVAGTLDENDVAAMAHYLQAQ